MAGVVHISEAANLALHAMILLAGEPEARIPAGEVAVALGVSPDHLAKVLQRLTRAGLLSSSRGPRGGFRLSRAADGLRLLEIYEAVEGPLPAHACLLGKPRCEASCMLGDFVGSANERFRAQLGSTRLSEVAGAVRRRPR